MSNKSNTPWFVYMLECANGKIYTGIAIDPEKRFQRHKSGTGAKFTQRNPPLHILAVRQCKNRSEACKLEWAMKQHKAPQKRAIAAQWKKKEAFS